MGKYIENIVNFKIIFFTLVILITTGASTQYIVDINSTHDTIEFVKQIKNELKTRKTRVEKFLGIDSKIVFKYTDAFLNDKKLIKQITDSKKDVKWRLKRVLMELEGNRLTLAYYEKNAKKQWDSKFKEKLPGSLNKANIYDLQLSSSRLGVILDNSPSMKHYLPNIQKEIDKNFENAFIRKVHGCSLRRYDTYTSPNDQPKNYKVGENEWYYIDREIKGLNPFRAELYLKEVPTSPYINSLIVQCMLDNLSAAKALTNVYEVDSIFWFSDFQDEIHDDIYTEFVKVFKEKNVKLYILTPKNAKIPKKIADLVKITKGKILSTKL